MTDEFEDEFEKADPCKRCNSTSKVYVASMSYYGIWAKSPAYLAPEPALAWVERKQFDSRPVRHCVQELIVHDKDCPGDTG